MDWAEFILWHFWGFFAKYLPLDIVGLLEQITNHLQENLKVETALDIMVAAHQTNQKVIFDSSVKFLYW